MLKTSVLLAWLCQVSVTLNLFQGLMLFRDAETQPVGWQEVRHDDPSKAWNTKLA